MKTDNKDMDQEATLIENEPKTQSPVIITILPLLSMLLAILLRLLRTSSGTELAKLGIITLLLTGALSFYIQLNADMLLGKRLAKTIISAGYLGSICLLLLIPEPGTFSFWMLGGLLAAMLIDSRLGLLLHFNLTFILGITYSSRPETVIQVLIMGVLMSMLAGALRKKESVIYAAIILLSSNITLAFAINNFVIKAAVNYNYMNSLFSILMVLIIAFLTAVFYDKANSKEASEEPKLVNAAELAEGPVMEEQITADEQKEEDSLIEVDTISNIGTRTSYEVLCDCNNELLQKLKQHSEALYSHAVYIGDLSCRAAQEIKANEKLAQAGGLYHEIGKLKGKNYIEEGLMIAQDYAFPTELQAILKEHNIKYEKPSSIEAAIVMLSDNVVSTIEYIEKTNDRRFTTEKIIDNIFQLRMEKGTFDSSALSLKDFKILKEFYLKEFSGRKIR